MGPSFVRRVRLRLTERRRRVADGVSGIFERARRDTPDRKPAEPARGLGRTPSSPLYGRRGRRSGARTDAGDRPGLGGATRFRPALEATSELASGRPRRSACPASEAPARAGACRGRDARGRDHRRCCRARTERAGPTAPAGPRLSRSGVEAGNRTCGGCRFFDGSPRVARGEAENRAGSPSRRPPSPPAPAPTPVRRHLTRHSSVVVSAQSPAESSAPSSNNQESSSTASTATPVSATPQPSVPAASSAPTSSSSSGSTTGASQGGSTGSQNGSATEHAGSAGGAGSTSKQPAFGANGALGPGSGGPGTQ